jgi:hypothetical protein
MTARMCGGASCDEARPVENANERRKFLRRELQ